MAEIDFQKVDLRAYLDGSDVHTAISIENTTSETIKAGKELYWEVDGMTGGLVLKEDLKPGEFVGDFVSVGASGPTTPTAWYYKPRVNIWIQSMGKSMRPLTVEELRKLRSRVSQRDPRRDPVVRGT